MSSRRLTIACVTALACAALSAAAGAQDLPPLPKEATDSLSTATEPAPYLKQQTGQNVDTDYTPIAKESKLWNLHQGARYVSDNEGGAETRAEYEARFAGSQNSASELVTTFDDELTDVAFANTRNGFAGGQRKLDCVAADGSPGTDGVPDTYVPAIYRYGDSPSGIRWLRPTAAQGGLLGSCSQPGFVGQIAWIRTTGMALAVGGDGSYPYRAPAYGKDVNGAPCAPDPTKPYGANCDQAGLGRAWLYNHGRWQELDYDPNTFPNRPDPDGPWSSGLHGMTALDVSPLTGTDFGFVGALGQIWPVLVEVKGQNGACEATDANQCVSFPDDGKIPGLLGDFDPVTNTYPPAAGKFDMDSNKPGDTDHAFRFRFRVRQIRVDNGDGNQASSVGAVAVTDGCCAGGPNASDLADGNGAQLGPAHNYPSVLYFDNTLSSLLKIGSSVNWGWQIWSADAGAQYYEHPAYSPLPEQQRRALPPPNARQDWPDSFYSVGFRYRVEARSRISVVASPGGPPPAEGAYERASLVSEPICFGTNATTNNNILNFVGGYALDQAEPGQLFAALRAQLASVRLVDGDGDELVAISMPVRTFGLTLAVGSPPWAGTPSNAQRYSGVTCSQGGETRNRDSYEPYSHDAVPDWSVGELRSTARPGLGARGLAFSTVSRPTLVPEVVDVGWHGDEEHPEPDPARVLATLADPVNNPPTTQEKLVAYLQSQHFFTGSYSLNAIDYLDGFGTGWAVGMHGGIVQLGGSEQGLASGARVEPEPPPLGSKRSGQAPERTPYEAFDPPSVVPPGAVPLLGARPAERLSEHVLRFAGAPDVSGDYANRRNNLGQLVMSRDGAEGWGLEQSPTTLGPSSAMTLFRYQGSAWSRCDPEGVDGVTRPDPACSALAPLRAYSINGQLRGVAVAAAARIPYENDSDASNDDDFEVFAIGTGYRTPEQVASAPPGENGVRPVLMRYREGAWRVENDLVVQEFLGGLNFSGTDANAGGYFYSDLAMAFAAPDDGWAIGGPVPGQRPLDPLLHFDGERWIRCTTSAVGVPKQTSGTSDSRGQGGDATKREDWCDDPERLTITAGEAPGENGSAQDFDNLAGLTIAGRRLYLYGSRKVRGTSYPLILCKDAGGPWRNDEGCGLDPGLPIREGGAAVGLAGEVTALSVAVSEDGAQRGWAAGRFDSGSAANSSTTSLLRLGTSGWAPSDDEGTSLSITETELIALPDGGGLIGGTIRFEADIGAWRAFPGSAGANLSSPDGRGGAWLTSGTDLIHYTDSPPKPVFTEAPTPLPREEESFTSLAGQPNGSLWASTSDGALYRYARSTGWDRVPIPGWRAERATVAPAAYAVAVNDSGAGVVVGREGRIADIAGSEVRLDQAAGMLCDLAAVVPPCGTSRHLRAAAVSPDGAAIVGGEHLALLWRPAGGQFRAIERPEVAPSSKITGLSLPTADIAYLATDEGQFFRGDLRGVCPHEADAEIWWCWRLENTDSGESLLTRDPTGVRKPAALYAVAVDASGHGYAAGERGVLLERTNEGTHPWRLLRSGVGYDLLSIALRGEHVLVGGTHGLVLTGSGERFAIARAADQDRAGGFYGGYSGSVVGLALAGGTEDGQSEAWAATDGRETGSGLSDSRYNPSGLNVSQLFHYASEESEPLLDPRRSVVRPLADSPAARADEVSLAALGKLDCHIGYARCSGDAYSKALSRHSVEAIAARAKAPNGPALTLFTGDVADDARLSGAATVGPVVKRVNDTKAPFTNTSVRSSSLELRANRTWLAEPLARAGLPFFAAIGGQDLSGVPCSGCLPTQELARAGLNDIWREAFAAEPAPWGKGKRFASERYESRPLASSGNQLYVPEPEQDAAGDPVEVKLLSGGARTHYAFDLVERESGRKLARFAFADNSLKSLAASDPIQHPTELDTNEGGTGQAGWLRRVLCVKGSGSRCSREPGQPAVVVANAPTYAYVNVNPRQLAADAATFESLLLQNDATAVISGSLGWNGRYWATAPGLHEPCQGEEYRNSPPRAGEHSCHGRSTEELPVGAGGVAPVTNQLASALGSAGPVLQEAQQELSSVTGGGLLPFVVASGAGGKLAGEDPGQGFFHGYTIVRVPGDANPAGVLVEQRPLYELAQITAASHVLRPGQKMTLKGVGRGPLVDDSAFSYTPRTASFEPIDAAAIGHRYDLVEADSAKPWLPRRAGAGQDPSTAASPGGDASARDDKEEASGPYVPLDPSVATVDSETGVIKVGKGNNPRTFALGLLSVGCSGTQAGADGACDPSDPGVHVATFPLLFESRRTFKPVVVAAPRVAQIRAQAQAALPQPPNPPQPPAVKGVELPNPPGVPVPPPIDVPQVNPPSPPVPPPPPLQQHPVPLDLSASAPGVTIAPQTTVIPPPAPPIQPAPPGGARREARQRQSATQSSGSGSGADERSSEIQESGGDLADGPLGPRGAQMTRIDRARADGGSMTAYYGASVTLLALVAAFGWNYGRPGPRRRSPIEAAPARAWTRRR